MSGVHCQPCSHHGGRAKNIAVVTDVDSLLLILRQGQNWMAQLNAQLTLLSYNLKKENQRAARNLLLDTVARREAGSAF